MFVQCQPCELAPDDTEFQWVNNKKTLKPCGPTTTLFLNTFNDSIQFVGATGKPLAIAGEFSLLNEPHSVLNKEIHGFQPSPQEGRQGFEANLI